MRIFLQLYDVIRLNSTVVIDNVLINISSLNLNKQIFLSLVLEYASELTTTPKTELICICKCGKFVGKNKVKICKL